jgi:hypothetical protein
MPETKCLLTKIYLNINYKPFFFFSSRQLFSEVKLSAELYLCLIKFHTMNTHLEIPGNKKITFSTSNVRNETLNRSDGYSCKARRT